MKTIETKMTVSELREALKASRAKVRLHFTAKGNPAWKCFYRYGKNDREIGTYRLTKKEANERLAEFGLTANLVIEIAKAKAEVEAAQHCHLCIDQMDAVLAKFAKAEDIKITDDEHAAETAPTIEELETKIAELRAERDQVAEYVYRSEDRKRYEELDRARGKMFTLGLIDSDADKMIMAQIKPFSEKLIAAEDKLLKLDAAINELDAEIYARKEAENKANRDAYYAYQAKLATTRACIAEETFAQYAVSADTIDATAEAEIELVANTVAEPDTEDYFELADELDEIGNDICETKDILERKIANGAPQTEIKSLEGYIDEREDEYRTLHKRIYDVNPQSDITVDTEQAANTVANENDGYDETAFDLLPIITEEEEELRDYLYDLDEKQEVLADKYEVNAPAPTPEIAEHEHTRIPIEKGRDMWLSQYWPIDTYIHTEDDNGNEIEITDDEVATIEKSLRGKYYINHTGDGVEFFAEDCTASLLSAICTELEDRGCYIEDYHYAWEEERAIAKPPESPVIEHMNRYAPEGWSIKLDEDKIRVEYQGKYVADAERIVNRDQLAPQAFFRQFQPLVDESKTPEQMFLDDRYRELEQLEEMRKSPECTPDARKKIDAMIEQIKRDIVEAEMYERDSVAAACKAGIFDEEGNLAF